MENEMVSGMLCIPRGVSPRLLRGRPGGAEIVRNTPSPSPLPLAGKYNNGHRLGPTPAACVGVGVCLCFLGWVWFPPILEPVYTAPVVGVSQP